MGLRETRLLRRMFSYARRPKGGALFLLADPVILMQMTRRFSRCCKYIHQNRIFCEYIFNFALTFPDCGGKLCNINERDAPDGGKPIPGKRTLERRYGP